MSPKIVLIAGKSNAGKTTLLEKLIFELSRRNWRVGTAKHAHDGFDFDKKGKDSWRHKQAGASTTLVVTDTRVAMVRDDRRNPVQKMGDFLGDMDLVLAEGFKRQALPKIEIFRKNGPHQTPLCLEDPHLEAFVTDADIQVNVPVFGLDEIRELADFVEARFIYETVRADAE